MTIVNMTEKGNIKLPREAVKHLRSSKHLQLKFNGYGVALMPVQIQTAVDLKAIPKLDDPKL